MTYLGLDKTNLEGDIGDGGNGEQVLHAVDDGVGRGGHGGVSNLQAHGRNVGNTCTIIRFANTLRYNKYFCVFLHP